jgi:hypothetical protein
MGSLTMTQARSVAVVSLSLSLSLVHEGATNIRTPPPPTHTHTYTSTPTHHQLQIAPAVLRLGWHASATYDPTTTPHGGSNGATMRFEPEATYNENRGLELAKEALFVLR